VILVPVAIWIYTLVFGFASLWFSHYCLAALAHMRAEKAAAEAAKAAAKLAADTASASTAAFPSYDLTLETFEPTKPPIVGRLN
jgi:hypothetical protein